MDKSCANHPESMALATCKACEKSVCLMCVVDEKEGTFCSADCHTAFVNGTEVPKFVGAAAESGSTGSAGVKKIDSIFDDEPAAPSAQLNPPPSDESIPIVAEGTKWRPIGAQCDNHSDTPAVANCDRCGKPVCALCLLEASQGTFCSADCLSAATSAPAEEAAPAPAPERERASAPARRAASPAPAAASNRAESAALAGRPVFKFKAPPKTNKTGVAIAVVIAVIVTAVGGYYGWNAFSPPAPVDPPVGEYVPPVDPVDPKKPDVVKQPDVKQPDVVKVPDPKKPDPKKPDPKKPDVPQPENPTYVSIPKAPKTPKPTVTLTRAMNPWSEKDPGTWYRIRTQKGNQVTYTDIGLKEKGKDFYVLTSQTASNGQAGAATDARMPVTTMYLRGEESFTYEGQSFLCEIRSPGLEDSAPRFWTLISGKNVGAVLKAAGGAETFTARRAWEHTLRVKNTPLDCLVVEAQIGARVVKRWHCGANPLGVVREESGDESIALVDLGSDWSKRPAFPKN